MLDAGSGYGYGKQITGGAQPSAVRTRTRFPLPARRFPLPADIVSQ